MSTSRDHEAAKGASAIFDDSVRAGLVLAAFRRRHSRRLRSAFHRAFRSVELNANRNADREGDQRDNYALSFHPSPRTSQNARNHEGHEITKNTTLWAL